jgi:putative flippase GtrA
VVQFVVAFFVALAESLAAVTIGSRFSAIAAVRIACSVPFVAIALSCWVFAKPVRRTSLRDALITFCVGWIAGVALNWGMLPQIEPDTKKYELVIIPLVHLCASLLWILKTSPPFVPVGACRRCGYDLSGSPLMHTCPECGAYKSRMDE